MTDLSTFSDDELDRLAVAARAEQERRQVLASAPAQAEALAQTYAAAAGREDGGSWEQPTGAHDAYPLGSVVEWDGARWASLVPANVWQPGTGPVAWTLWQRLDPDEGTGPGTPPDEEPPPTPAWDGNGHAYAAGELVTFDGGIYRCRQGHTSQPGWTPAGVAALWEPITPT